MSCVWEGFEARELLRGLSLEERSFQFRALGCLKDLESGSRIPIKRLLIGINPKP